MKYLKKYEMSDKKYLTKYNDEDIEPITDGHYVPEITLDELENRKEQLYNKFKEDEKLSHLSDDVLRTVVNVTYDLEIKNGLLRIIDEN